MQNLGKTLTQSDRRLTLLWLTYFCTGLSLTHLYLHGVVKVNVESVARAIREKLLRV